MYNNLLWPRFDKLNSAVVVSTEIPGTDPIELPFTHPKRFSVHYKLFNQQTIFSFFIFEKSLDQTIPTNTNHRVMIQHD